MNVGQVKKMLEQYPDNMEVLNERCSDYEIIEEHEWTVVKGVPQDGVLWVMRSHSTMSEENKKKEREYLLLDGN